MACECCAAKDAAYHERDQLVGLISKIYPSHLTHHEGADWEDNWRNIVCVHLPTGQATWHIHTSELSLFDHLRVEESHWDGHATKEKYERVNRVEARCAT